MLYPNGDFSLGLSTCVISHKLPESLTQPLAQQRRRKCQRGMTGAEKRLLRSALYLIEKTAPKNQMSFLTLTLPSLSEVELVEISNSWAEVVRRFVQELKRLLQRHGLPETVAGCTEIQEKRWKKRGEVAPHVHLIFKGRLSQESWAIQPKKIKQIWQRILSDMLGRKVNCDYATRIEQVQKSPVAYMSKYMSKGGKVLKEITDKYGDILPTSWLVATKNLRIAVHEEMIEPPSKFVDYLASNLSVLKAEGLIAWYGRLWSIRINGKWEIHFEREDKPLDVGRHYKKLIAISGSFVTPDAMWEVIGRGLAD